MDEAPDDHGKTVFALSLPLVEAARSFADAAQVVLDKHGEAGYLKDWIEHPFPTETLATIERELDRLTP